MRRVVNKWYRVWCENCQKEIKVRVSAYGRKIRCPRCGGEVYEI